MFIGSSNQDHATHQADARSMPFIGDGSVHLIVTSPPYWNIKDYGHTAQIGFGETYPEYLDSLSCVWRECFRVLHEGCRLCVNVGDLFTRASSFGRHKIIPIHADIISACESAGFDFMGQIIWHKATNTHAEGGGRNMGSYPYPRNGIVRLNHEYILLFKKLGTPPKPTAEQKEASKMSNGEWNTYFTGHWFFSGVRQTNHIAAFPEELPRRLINMFSFPGEIVLDPFAGSGTTARVAAALSRKSVSVEVNPEFIRLIEETIGQGFTEPVPQNKILANTKI